MFTVKDLAQNILRVNASLNIYPELKLRVAVEAFIPQPLSELVIRLMADNPVATVDWAEANK